MRATTARLMLFAGINFVPKTAYRTLSLFSRTPPTFFEKFNGSVLVVRLSPAMSVSAWVEIAKVAGQDISKTMTAAANATAAIFVFINSYRSGRFSLRGAPENTARADSSQRWPVAA